MRSDRGKTHHQESRPLPSTTSTASTTFLTPPLPHRSSINRYQTMVCKKCEKVNTHTHTHTHVLAPRSPPPTTSLGATADQSPPSHQTRNSPKSPPQTRSPPPLALSKTEPEKSAAEMPCYPAPALQRRRSDRLPQGEFRRIGSPYVLPSYRLTVLPSYHPTITSPPPYSHDVPNFG